mmetsp:Transcript_33626/g.34127  ORF Transcript_33626/g.34127 Transcript_33626/m.34127 type:complete len:365 (-) Transcript_33626:693-1787(-)
MIRMVCQRDLVACNVYVSAGRTSHRALLLDLLEKTQEHCFYLNTKNNSPKQVVVVEAFSDGPYDRSSFHIAGISDLVSIVGSSLAVSAVEALLRFEPSSEEDDSQGLKNEKGSPHPTVGLVDHVSVLPLNDVNVDSCRNNDGGECYDENIPGSVARKIGDAMSSKNVNILYYGTSHPEGTPLATVRRESTRFFHSDGGKSTSDGELGCDGENNVISVGQTTVGSPDRFVENYNIRLRRKVSRSTARSLTEYIRERSGIGLPKVEALTLAYGPNQYEVACNLLDPSVTSAEDIEQRIRMWENQQELLQNQKPQDHSYSGLVDISYRVGTTSDMCLNALREVETVASEKAYNQATRKRLEKNLCVD